MPEVSKKSFNALSLVKYRNDKPFDIEGNKTKLNNLFESEQGYCFLDFSIDLQYVFQVQILV